jgi:folate-binding protein YgfZ
VADDAFLASYEAVVTGRAVLPLSAWTTVLMAGDDRASFLHNMCTNDIRGLAVGDAREAFLTDVKGKIVGHVVVMAAPNELLLVSVPHQADRIIAQLDRYIIREKVVLADVSTNFSWSLASRTFAMNTDDFPLSFPCSQWRLGGRWVGGTGSATQAGEPATATEVRVWTALRIESGWPLFGVDFDGSNLPQEVGRDAQAISFRKGCYLGQETIARIDALGHVNKRLATVKFAGDEPPTPGAELTADGQIVGRVTSAGWSPRFGSPLALAMLRRGHNAPGERLLCGGQPAEVIPTPAVPHLAPAPD